MVKKMKTFGEVVWGIIKDVLANKRVKSFLWRLGMMILALIVGSLLAELDSLSQYISPAFVTVLGLILGEISKAIANALKEKS